MSSTTQKIKQIHLKMKQLYIYIMCYLKDGQYHVDAGKAGLEVSREREREREKSYNILIFRVSIKIQLMKKQYRCLSILKQL